MTAVSLYLDEDVHTFIADAVRRRGWQAITTEEADRCGPSIRINCVSPLNVAWLF